ncbi:MAG: DUF4190 domain-containing protein [Planctomycetota bacterium]|nr:DUF4190 domain-containing protein [Planctomycetota bacterium]
MSQYPPPMSGTPPMNPGSMMRPHRGTLVLVMGILGLVVCVICGILAWMWGKEDLKAIDAGQMDPAGRSLTQVGKILGMVSVILNLVILGIWVLMMVVAGGAAAVGAGGP